MKAKNLLVSAILIFFAVAVIAFPQKYVSACFEGFGIWAESVLPSLFPFMIVTALLIKIGAAEVASKPFVRACKKLKLPSAAAPLFAMSACSGYPAGSRMVSEYYASGLISENDCKKLAPLCSVAGPLFITGTVGYRAFGGGTAGVKLMCACLLSVLSTSLFYCLLSKQKQVENKPLPLAVKSRDALYESFYGSVIAVCLAGGYIAFFFTLSRVLTDFKILSPLSFALSPLIGKECAAAFVGGLCEATGGCFALAKAGGFFALPLAGFLITFGGASIIAQQAGYLNKCNVKTGFFTLFKLFQGLVCFALLCLFSLF